MKNYLSFGGGVNSVAMMLYCLDEGWDFEAVFVDHGTDYPETYEYLDTFQEWLDKRAVKPITVLEPKFERYGTVFNNLYNLCERAKMVPSPMRRWCTAEFKVKPLMEYYKKPCFQLLGIDAGESRRAKLSTEKGVESRFPLIEAEMNRDDCKEYIKSKGLPVPMKSGCYICPFQTARQWKELRMNHPDLFCKAEQLEKRNMEYRISKGKEPLYLSPRKASLRSVVDENQSKLWKQDEYPPCECML